LTPPFDEIVTHFYLVPAALTLGWTARI